MTTSQHDDSQPDGKVLGSQEPEEVTAETGPTVTTRRNVLIGGGVVAGAAAAAMLVPGGARALNTSPFKQEIQHGTGDFTEPYGAKDVIYSMCMQCNTYCTIKVKLASGEGSGATSLVRKIDGNPYSPLNTQPVGPVPYATPLVAAAAGVGDMATESRSRTGGMACLKGQAGVQTVHNNRRITQPLRRVGPRGSGKWETITWEDALAGVVEGDSKLGTPGMRQWWAFAPAAKVEADLELVSQGAMTKADFDTKWRDILIDVEHPDLGPKSNLLTVLGGDRMFLIGDRFVKQSFGSINAFNHGGVCGVTGVIANARTHPTTGHKRMYGDIDHCDYLIVWGTEPVTANKGPTWLAPRISNARRRGMKMVVIDPRMSKTAAKADTWIPVKPANDGALAFALGRWIVDNERYDARYLRAPGLAAAEAIGEPTFSDATHLVMVDTPKRAKLSLMALGLAEPPAPLPNGDPGVPERAVLVNGKVTGATTSELADLDVDTVVDGPEGPIRVKSVFRLLKERLQERPLAEYCEQAGVEQNVVEEVAREFTSHGKRAAVMSYRGPAMHANGYDTVRAIGYLNFLIGNHDWKGGHLAAAKKHSPMTGRYDLEIVADANKAWGIPITREKTEYEQTSFFAQDNYPAPRRWYPLPGNLCHEVLPSLAAQYPYRHLGALFMHRHSPIDSSPGGHRQAEVMKNTDAINLLVSFDVEVGDSSMYADYVLPDLTYLERFTQESIYPSQQYQLTQMGQPTTRAFEGPRSVESFYLALAKELGMPGVGADAFGPGTHYESDEDYWLKMVANIAFAGEPVPDADDEEMEIFLAAREKALGKYFDVDTWKKAVTEEEWSKVVYVLNRGGRFEEHGEEAAYEGEWLKLRYGGECQFYDPKTASLKDSITGEFFDGLATLMPVTFSDRTQIPASGQYQMINWKSRSQGTHRTVNSPWLREVRQENHLWMNASDAAAKELVNGDRVKIVAPQATALAQVRIVQGMRPGVVGANYSFGHLGYSASDIEIDGTVIQGVGEVSHNDTEAVPGKEELGYAGARGRGFSVNGLLLEDRQSGGGGLSDPIGGGAAQLDLFVDIIKV